MASSVSLVEGPSNSVDSQFVNCVVIIGEKQIKLHFIIKNIVNSGWSWRPDVKRIQISSLAKCCLKANTASEITFLIGVYFINEKTVFAVWNPACFTFHSTNRSCYVMKDSLLRASNGEFLYKEDYGQMVFVCLFNQVSKLILEFIAHDKVA